jgi:hypothetical protein
MRNLAAVIVVPIILLQTSCFGNAMNEVVPGFQYTNLSGKNWIHRTVKKQNLYSLLNYSKIID